MAARFEIFEDPTGKYRFHFKASDREIVATSESYETLASTEKAIEMIKSHAADAVVETRHRSASQSDDSTDHRVSGRDLLTDLSDCPNGNEHRLTSRATYSSADGLTVEGWDSTEWPCDDLTITCHVAPQHITQLLTALGGGGDDDPVELLAQHYDDGTLKTLWLESWLRRHGIDCTATEVRHPN